MNNHYTGNNNYYDDDDHATMIMTTTSCSDDVDKVITTTSWSSSKTATLRLITSATTSKCVVFDAWLGNELLGEVTAHIADVRHWRTQDTHSLLDTLLTQMATTAWCAEKPQTSILAELKSRSLKTTPLNQHKERRSQLVQAFFIHPRACWQYFCRGFAFLVIFIWVMKLFGEHTIFYSILGCVLQMQESALCQSPLTFSGLCCSLLPHNVISPMTFWSSITIHSGAVSSLCPLTRGVHIVTRLIFARCQCNPYEREHEGLLKRILLSVWVGPS